MDFQPYRPTPEDFKSQKGEWRQTSPGGKRFQTMGKRLGEQNIHVVQQGGLGAKEEESGYRQYPRQWEEYIVAGVGKGAPMEESFKKTSSHRKPYHFTMVHYPRREEERVVEGYGKGKEENTPEMRPKKRHGMKFGRKEQPSIVHYPKREEEYVVTGVGVGRGYTDDDEQIFRKQHASDPKYVQYPKHAEYVVEGIGHGRGHGDERGKQLIQRTERSKKTTSPSYTSERVTPKSTERTTASTVRYPRREEEHVVTGVGTGKSKVKEEQKSMGSTSQATPGFGPQRQWGSGTTETTGGKYGRPKKIKTQRPSHFLDEIPKAAEQFYHKKGVHTQESTSDKFTKPKRAQTH